MNNCLKLMLLAALSTSLACACGRSDRELNDYIQSTLARPGSGIEPLPPIEEFESFEYVVEDDRDPFSNPITLSSIKSVAGMGPRPNPDRRKELLESYPLDSLSMVGTLYNGSKMTALIIDSSNVVHKIRPGNYLGQNDGKVIAVQPDKVTLRELIPDGGGAWTEREAEVTIEETE